MTKNDFLWALIEMREGEEVMAKRGTQTHGPYKKEEGNLLCFDKYANSWKPIESLFGWFIDPDTEWFLNLPKIYYIYKCKYCESQLEESTMGKKCPFCNRWTYSIECRMEVTLKNDNHSK